MNPSPEFLAQHFPSLNPDNIISTRRQFLQRTGMGLGWLGLAGLIKPTDSAAAGAVLTTPKGGQPLHFPARAKHVIHIFLEGAPSHLDTWDPKPELKRLDGKSMPGGDGLAFGSPFEFIKQGKSGIEVSEVFPQLGGMVDEMSVIRSMWTDIPAHETATVFMNTGSLRLPRPSMGSWALYGLGTLNENLPGFISLRGANLPNGGTANWQSVFLPGRFQGTSVNTNAGDVNKIIENLRNQYVTLPEQRKQLDLVRQLDEMHNRALDSDSQLEAEIASFEMAFKMQTEATDAFDINKESVATREAYGIGPNVMAQRQKQGKKAQANPAEVGKRLLIARRLVERGVRVVQVFAGGWDMHGNLKDSMENRAASIDQPIAALLKDLKERGLLDSTLVMWGGEFGRTAGRDRNGQGDTAGRDHNAKGFCACMAGGGVKGGYVHGATDELGQAAALDKVHVHDLHATVLRLLGFDHEKLTHRYNGRDFRLTDVAGKVVSPILA
ncbi:MAG: hypothetical protein JWL81_3065 [Verrucomicrobiales bacterium]|nr:hypothetical protein [Verrucomicrobiales bacterium]